MGNDKRVTYRRRHCYATRSNRIAKARTPGGFTIRYVKKRSGAPKCGDCHRALPGIASMNSLQRQKASKSKLTVSRCYGGSRCSSCVKQRIVRAFLFSEQQLVKKMLLERLRSAKK